MMLLAVEGGMRKGEGKKEVLLMLRKTVTALQGWTEQWRGRKRHEC